MGAESKTSAFGLNSWTTGETVDIQTDVRVTAGAGYQYVEILDRKIETFLAAGRKIEHLREILDRNGLKVLSVNTLDDATLQTGAGLDHVAARCETLCQWAKRLNSPYIIVGPSYLPADNVPAKAHIIARSAAALKRFVEIADAQSVRIAFEFHGYARCSVNNLAMATEILDAVGDRRLGLVIDAFHFYVGGSQFADLEALDRSRLFIVHLADVEHDDRRRLGKPNRVFPGDGVLPLRDLVASLKRIDYPGPYSLELFRPEYWAMDPAIVAKRGLSSMRKFI